MVLPLSALLLTKMLIVDRERSESEDRTTAIRFTPGAVVDSNVGGPQAI